MADIRRTVSLGVIADLDDYANELQRKFPDLTKKAATAAALKMQGAFLASQTKMIADSKKSAEASSLAWKTALNTVATQISAQAAIGWAKATLGAAKEIADLQNQIGDLSAATGVATDTLSGIKFAAESSGGSLAELEAGFKGLPKRIDDFARGAGEGKVALEELGFSAKDGERWLGDMDGGLREIVGALQGIEDPGARAAAATRIFGDAGVRLNQVLGTRDLEDWTDAAERFAVDVSPQAIAQSQEYQRHITILSSAFTKAKGDLISMFRIGDLVREAGAVIAGFGAGFTTAIDQWIEGMGWLATTIRFAFSGEFSLAAEAAKKWATSSVTLFGNIADAANEGADAYRDEVNAQAEVVEAITATLPPRDKVTKAAKAATSAAKDEAAARKEAAAAYKAWVAGIDLAEDRAKAAVDAIGGAVDAVDDVIAGLTEAWQEWAVRTVDTFATIANGAADIAGTTFDYIGRKAAETVDKEKEGLAKLREERKAAEAEVLTSTNTVQNARRSARLAEIEGEIEAGEKILASRRKASRQAAIASRGAALFGVGVNAAEAVLKSFALFGPPPSPAGIAGAISAGVAAATQTASILAAPLPSFFRGSSRTQEGLASLHKDEAVLNARATEALGRPIVDALNAGLAPLAAFGGGGGGGPVYLDRRQVGAAMARDVRAGGALSSAMVRSRGPRTGISSPYGRS